MEKTGFKKFAWQPLPILFAKKVEYGRLFTIFFLLVLAVSFILQTVLAVFHKGIFSWKEYYLLVFILFITFLLMTVFQKQKKMVWLGKYIGGLSATLLWTLTIAFAGFGTEKIAIWGYFIVFVPLVFFRAPRAIIFSGILSFLGYGFLFYTFPNQGVLKLALDLILLGSSCGIAAFIAYNLKQYYFNLLAIQEEAEMSKTVLEIRVQARTRELKIITESLEAQAQERTKKLQEKIKELERFQRLTLGRELRMIELKKEIKKLNEELEKHKPR